MRRDSKVQFWNFCINYFCWSNVACVRIIRLFLKANKWSCFLFPAKKRRFIHQTNWVDREKYLDFCAASMLHNEFGKAIQNSFCRRANMNFHCCKKLMKWHYIFIRNNARSPLDSILRKQKAFLAKDGTKNIKRWHTAMLCWQCPQN